MADREVWKPIPGFEGYEVSNKGRVRSVDRIVKHRENSTKQLRGRILQQSWARGGLKVTLSIGHRVQYQRTVPCLVMLAFCGPPPRPKLDVCHNDGNPANNKLANLRYDTRKGNLADRWKHGRMNIGQMNGTSRLTEKQVKEIRKSSAGLKAICEKYGITISTAWSIRARKSWAWVT